MTKKSATTAPQGGTGTGPGTGPDMTQEKLNELYTAHQVHTLAQLIYQQVAARRGGGNPWAQSPGAGMPFPMSGQQAPMSGQPFQAGQSNPGGWTANAQGAPQPLIYWYP